MERKTVRIEIEGMSCGHCVKTVREALQGITGVEIQDVEIGRAVVNVDPGRTSNDVLAEAIDDTGFVVKSIA